MSTERIAEERRLPWNAEHVRPEIEAVRSSVTDLEQQARKLIRQRPVAAVLAAVGFGYLVARLVSRGSR
jgi:hypothetical protein